MTADGYTAGREKKSHRHLSHPASYRYWKTFFFALISRLEFHSRTSRSPVRRRGSQDVISLREHTTTFDLGERTKVNKKKKKKEKRKESSAGIEFLIRLRQVTSFNRSRNNLRDIPGARAYRWAINRFRAIIHQATYTL